MKIKRGLFSLFTSVLILGLAFGGGSITKTSLNQALAQAPADATGSRGGIIDTTPPIVYISPASFSEGFDDITNLPEWYMQNNSEPVGSTGWFQGNDSVFPAHAGEPWAYIGANFNNTAGVGTISNWLLTPEQALTNGATFSFWTRTAEGSIWPDRLQVRLSTEGDSTDVGIGAEDVGVFTTLLLDINPNLEVGGYPEAWTQYIVELSGLPEGTNGRMAFRYYVTDGGPMGNNSNYIGIDTVEYTNPPSIELDKTVGTEPGVCATTEAITVTVGTEVTYCYDVTNTGGVTLNLHDLYDTQLGTLLDNYPYALGPGESVSLLSGPVTMNETTVNTATWTAFNQIGYLYDDTIPLNFEDISGTGTPFVLTDDSVSAPLPLGFAFNYFGVNYTDVYASSNGFLTVLAGQSNGCCSGMPFPTAGNPDGVIAGWWEDLNPSAGGSLYYQTLGSAPNRYAIVQYSGIPHYPSGNEVTLQYKLFEGSNQIEVHYIAAPSDGGTHSAGLENEDGTLGTQYYRGTSPLTTPLAVRYTYLSSSEQAAASDTALVNVLFPEIDIAPSSLESIQLPDSAVSKIMTISNTGDPITTLEWMVLESQPGPNFTSPPAAAAQTAQQRPGAAAELVGAALPDGSLKAPSNIDLNQNPYVPTDVLYDNGPFVTHPGGGAGGADASALQTALGLSTYGFGHQLLNGYRVADDFTVVDAGGWQVDTITFFAYQTGSGNNSTITAVNLQIWDGVPGDAGSNVVWGDPVTNIMVNTTWSNIYRVLDTALTNADRPVMANTVAVDFHLDPGTYWLDWQSDGTLASGPWAPPISILGQTTTGNARQYTGAWADLIDTGTGTVQGLPFVIEGSLGGCVGDIPWASVSPITGTIPGGESTPVEVTFDSTGLSTGIYTGTLCVISNDPDEGLTEVPLMLDVVAGSDLTVSKSDSADPVRVGEQFTYTLEVTNDGLDANPGVMLEDALPGNVAFVSASAGCTHAAGVVTCDVGALGVGESATINIVVVASSIGTATNMAEVWSDYPDPDPSNNVAEETTLIIPAIYNFYLPIVLRP